MISRRTIVVILAVIVTALLVATNATSKLFEVPSKQIDSSLAPEI